MSEQCCCNKKEKNIFLPSEATVLKNEQVTQTETHLTLKLKNEKQLEFHPGQIMELSLFGYGEIPLGFASSPTRTENFEVVIRKVGRVSSALYKLKGGDSVYIRGPLGHGFDLNALRNEDVLIVAGGIGLCPTRSLIQYILDRRDEFKRFILFFGAKSPKEQLFLDDLRKWRVSDKVEFFETVDRGDPSWKGNVGLITSLFSRVKLSPSTKTIICGPPVMYKFVIKELFSHGISGDNIYLDLERRMKCGLGKCGHCQINDKYVCLDGPVFKFSEIRHLEEAL